MVPGNSGSASWVRGQARVRHQTIIRSKCHSPRYLTLFLRSRFTADILPALAALLTGVLAPPPRRAIQTEGRLRLLQSQPLPHFAPSATFSFGRQRKASLHAAGSVLFRSRAGSVFRHLRDAAMLRPPTTPPARS